MTLKMKVKVILNKLLIELLVIHYEYVSLRVGLSAILDDLALTNFVHSLQL